ncbi:MAG: hypothetical protein M1617_03625 [Actinobacteria bacterium]|nr:hypothetical protein [Actinomycetota bacterium]MCL5887379.1 hypothetical protein [Actinomycetota bacterium]
MRTDRAHKELERAIKLAETPMPEDVRQRLRATTMASVRVSLPRTPIRPGIRLVRMAALAALAVALFGGTAYAVMRSAPGDVLFPIREAASKIGVGQVPLEPPAEEPLERKLAPVVPPATDADETEYRESEGTYESDPAEPKEEADPADESEPAEPRGRRGEHSEPQESEPQEREPQESEYPDYREESNGRRGGSGLAMDEEWREPPTQEDAYYEDGSADSY